MRKTMSGVTDLPDAAALPATGGSYVVVLYLQRPATITAGALGDMELAAGYYLYAGSARGPGGLRARLGRHLAGSPRRRWHIDYLRAIAQPAAAWFVTGAAISEHRLARELSTDETMRPAGTRFGASDCDCPTHLFYSRARPACNATLTKLGVTGL